jgi:hypothetical protein
VFSLHPCDKRVPRDFLVLRRNRDLFLFARHSGRLAGRVARKKVRSDLDLSVPWKRLPVGQRQQFPVADRFGRAPARSGRLKAERLRALVNRFNFDCDR